MKSSYQKFAKDTLVIGIAHVLVALSRIILLPLLTKTLGAHDYGIWTQIQVTISLGLGVIGLGLPYAVTRFLPAKTKKEELQEEFWSVFCIVALTTLVVSLILIAAAGFIAEAFFEGATEIVRITGLIVLVWSLNGVLLSLFRALRQMKRYALFTIADAYAQVGLLSFLVLNGHGLLSIVLAILAIRTALFLPLFLLIKSQIGIKKPQFSKIKEYLNFGLPTLPGNIAGWVVASSDRYIIGYFWGAASVGAYSAAYALGTIPSMLSALLSFILVPATSKLYDERRFDEVRNHLRYSLKYFLMMLIPFVFGAAMLSKQVLRIFSTPEIASQGYFVVPLVALGTLLVGASGVIGQILILVKKTKVVGMLWIIAATVNLGLNVLLIPNIGILGAAITTLIAYALALGIATYYSGREFRFGIEWSFVFKSLVASVVMSLVIWRINPQKVLAVILTIVVGIIVYGLLLLLLKAFGKKEIEFFRKLIGSR